MWKDDSIWLPLVVQGKKFDAEFLFRGHEIIVSYTLNIVDSFDIDPETAILVSRPQGAITA
jgi:hypothetical protein